MSMTPSSEETPDLQGAYPRLSDEQIAALAAQRRHRVALVIVFGVWLLVLGVMETALALRAISFRHRAGARAIHAT
jgi:hypothetical protein